MKTLAFLLLVFSINIFAWDEVEITGVLNSSPEVEIVASPKVSIAIKESTIDWRNNTKLVKKTPALFYTDLVLKVPKNSVPHRSLLMWHKNF